MVEEEKKAVPKVTSACTEEEKERIWARYDEVLGPRSLKSISEISSNQEKDSWISMSHKAVGQPDKSFEVNAKNIDIVLRNNKELHDPRIILSSNVNQQWDSSLNAFKADKSIPGGGNEQVDKDKPKSCLIKENPSVLNSLQSSSRGSSESSQNDDDEEGENDG